MAINKRYTVLDFVKMADGSLNAAIGSTAYSKNREAVDRVRTGQTSPRVFRQQNSGPIALAVLQGKARHINKWGPSGNPPKFWERTLSET